MPKQNPRDHGSACVNLRWHPGNVAEICVPAATETPCVFSDSLLQSIRHALDEVSRHATKVEGLVITTERAAEDTDRSLTVAILQLQQLAHSAESVQRKFCREGQDLFLRLAELDCPVVAAIDGPCTGSLFELALWCDYRVAVEHDDCRWGFPEIELGLTPAWGGSVRLPRLIPLALAASLLTSGQTAFSKQTVALGMVDETARSGDLLATGLRATRSLRNDGMFRTTRLQRSAEIRDARQQLDQLTPIAEAIVQRRSIFPFAPTVLLEHIARTALYPQHAALDSETQAFVQTCGSPANLGLLNHQSLLLHNRQRPGLVDLELKTARTRSIGIVGAGLMGSTIAANCFDDGSTNRSASIASKREVVILDADAAVADAAATRVLEKYPAANVRATDSFGQIGQCDVVIETVVENLEIKQSVLEKISAAAGSDTLIATNTSAIPVGKLAAFTKHPESFCGIHFCHPELMSLVEVICGPRTTEQTVTAAVQFVRALGKMPVAMNDGAGFVVNRLLSAMVDQSLRLLTSGVRIETIDLAMREFGFQGGPFEIMDVIGIDTCMYAGQTMWNAGLSCVSLSPILPRLVKRKRLGRKTGAGFYRYTQTRGPAESDDEHLIPIIEAYLDRPLAAAEQEPKQSERIEIRNQILAAVTREAANIVDEEIVADIRDIDLCIIHGFSFPKHWGGILFWADQFGIAEVVRVLDSIAVKEPKLAATKMLRSMAVNGKKFYG